MGRSPAVHDSEHAYPRLASVMVSAEILMATFVTGLTNAHERVQFDFEQPCRQLADSSWKITDWLRLSLPMEFVGVGQAGYDS
ncbi:MAG: hypothetical protein F6K42_31275 [Leptolyngbya sp. SIO1D8]|nr:hypothetical protein [Leptolyngbya sp. SIO1D8]